MTKPVVAVTRRLPSACEARLAVRYETRLGDDAIAYDGTRIVAHAAGAAALIVTPAETCDAAVIKALPASIKLISSVSVGFEHIDLEAARRRGVRITNTPDVLTDATADIALLLLLGASRRATEGDRILRAGTWNGLRPTFLLGSQITGKRLGIVGMGRIGAAFADRARACGMTVLYHNRRPVPDAGDAVYCASLDDLLERSDVLSLHCPLTAETKGLLDGTRLAKLPHGAIVINTARGGLVDDEALIAALRSGHVGAAGLDVFANEPKFHPGYLALDNVMLLPHLGSATLETRTAMGMLAIDNVDAVLEGREPPHPLA
jgi:glyoxylate reductase